MAQYQHLPIYKLTYDILLRTMVATKDFPREYKHTLGQKIKDELMELVILIYRANSATNKQQHIESIMERIQAIQLLMRLTAPSLPRVATVSPLMLTFAPAAR